MGILHSSKKGIEIGIISSGFSDQIVKKRAEMLGIKNCYVGRDSKIDILDQWIQEKNLSYDEVAMIGDDINDLSIMNKIGFSACPSDSVNEVKAICDVILQKKGGTGCVREFIDEYISHKKN
jgi:YrbI family 3-deoxy-D-manno-octulosonate 8-phosphate phosphatase